MFSLTRQEILSISQFVISSSNETIKFSKNVNAFTEQGVAMLSGVLHSKRAILVNIAVMRAFVRLRHILLTHKELAEQLKELKQKVGEHDGQIFAIFEAIKKLTQPEEKPPKRIGFVVD
jgi:DNA-binding TFAR19-related protein (PDSD5 family)